MDNRIILCFSEIKSIVICFEIQIKEDENVVDYVEYIQVLRVTKWNSELYFVENGGDIRKGKRINRYVKYHSKFSDFTNSFEKYPTNIRELSDFNRHPIFNYQPFTLPGDNKELMYELFKNIDLESGSEYQKSLIPEWLGFISVGLYGG